MKVKKTKNTTVTKAKKSEEPMVKVLQVNVNPENPRNGFFELDWNDEFVNMLKQNGYTGASEEEIVDRWFQTICRNIALEMYEQQQADPENRAMASDMRVVKARDLGDGRTEVS